LRLVNELSERYGEWIRQALDPKIGEAIETIDSFRVYMMEQARLEKMRAERRNEPNAILKAAFFEYMNKFADDFFIESHIQQHNALM
jgi:3-phosphoglycerate kinase